MENHLDYSARPAAPRQRAVRSRWFVPVLCIVGAAAMALFSAGFLEPDEIMHYLYARAVWHDWRNLVNIWGRMGVTGLFCLAAPLGVTASRLLAVGVMALTAYGTSRLWHALQTDAAPKSWFGRHATAWIWLLLFAQPCFAVNSFTVMSEMLLACAWVWAAVVLLIRRTNGGVLMAGLLVGLGGLMRPEGWLVVAAWPVILAVLGARDLMGELHTKRSAQFSAIAASTLLAVLPVAAWYVLGVVAWHDARWVVANWPWAPVSQYGQTGGLFLGSSIVALAGWMWIPVIVASWDAWKERSAARLLFLSLPVAAFFLLHGILGSLGLFGSMSLPRYFICVAPLLAVLGVQGLVTMELRKPQNRLGLRVSIVIFTLLPIGALAATGYLPMRPTSEQKRLELVAQTLVDSHVLTEQIIVGHPYLLLRLGLDPDAPSYTRVQSERAISTARPGTIVVTDSTLWVYENRPNADQLSFWGYHIDKRSAVNIDKIPAGFEPLLFRRDPEARVRIWARAVPPPVPPARLTTTRQK